MQQWLNDPHNQPKVYGIAFVVMALAISFILFQLGIFTPQQPYIPPTPNGPPNSPPVAYAPPPVPPASTGPVPPGQPHPPVTVASASKPGASAKKKATGVKPVSVIAEAPSAPNPFQPGGVPPPVAATATVASVPNARKDPFAPYVDLQAYFRKLLKGNDIRPRVDTYAPPLTITTYVPPAISTFQPNPANVASTPGQNTNVAANIGRVSGVMLGTGAYAIIDNNGSSVVLQPGDQLPNGAGEIYSIQSDSISVKVNGQIVKVPISTGDAGNADQNGNNPGGGPPGNG